MRSHLSVLIPTALVAALLTFSAVFYLFTMHSTERSLREDGVAELNRVITLLQNMLDSQLTQDNLEGANLSLSVTAMHPAIRTLLLADEHDRVMLANRFEWREKSADEVARYDKAIAAFTHQRRARDISIEENVLVRGYYPITISVGSLNSGTGGDLSSRVGVLFVEMDLSARAAILRRDAQKTTAAFVGIAFLTTLAIAFLLHRRVTRRVRSLTQATKRLVAGDMNARAELHGGDELAQLGHAFDEMAAALQAQRQRIATNETQLEQALNRLNEAQRLAIVGSWELDIVANHLVWSDEIFRIFELDQTQFGASYESFLNAIYPDDRDVVNKAYTDSLTNRKPYEIMHRLQMADGRIKYVREKCESFFDRDGKPLRSVGTVQDITELHQAETAMRDSEALFTKVFHSNPVAAAVRRLRDDVIIECNAAFERQFGYSREEVIGRRVTDLNFYIDPNEGGPVVKKVLRRETIQGMELRAKNARREPMHLLMSVDYVFLRGEECALANFTDITARKLAEQALRTSENLLRQAMNVARLGVWMWDITTDVTVWQGQMFEIYGVDPAHFTGKGSDYIAFTRSDYRHTQEEKIKRAFENGVTEEQLSHGQDIPIAPQELCIVRPDGTEIYTLGNAVAVIDDQGKPLRMVGITMDITERKRTEAKMQAFNATLEQRVEERTAQLREAQKTARLGSWQVNSATGELVWSDEVYSIHGLDPASYRPNLQSYYRDIIHPDDVERVRREEQDAYSSGRQHQVDYRIRCPDGTERWVHVQGIAATGPGSSQIRGTVQDITARKRVEAELIAAKEASERANSAKNEFLSRMSHELRTPMNAILGFAQVLEIEEIDPARREFAAEIRRAGDHLLGLIDELLDLSRIESGKLTVVIEPVELQTVLTDAIRLSDEWIARRRLTVRNLNDPDAMVLADALRLKQVLVNLISNAAKYNRDEGKIVIETTTTVDHRLRISVADSGIGIAPENVERLFTPFDRLGAEFSAVEGTGIGLALSKELAELMGGTMGAESVEGQGSTFWIELPLTAIDAKPVVPKHVDLSSTGATKTVLYVEDNAANLRVVLAMLKSYSHLRLLSATDGVHGLDLARRYRPDAILIDIHLPGMDGFAILQALKADAATRDIPCIALSADAMPIEIDRGMKAGFIHYLTKPIKANELFAVLGRALASNHSH